MDKNKVWQKILDKIKMEVTSANFRTWFSKTLIDSITNTHITITVPTAFNKNQLISRYSDLLTESISEITQKQLTIQYRIDSSLFNSNSQNEPLPEDIFQLPQTPPITNITLNPKYTLDSFVVGLTNNLAYAAAQAVTQNPGLSYNPLFIYGPSGVGKTHLMQGIGNSLIKNNPQVKIVYISSERFMVDFVDSIQTKKMGDFRSKYRNCDILLIDDIQFISGKDSMQEEFFHTFNELHSRNAQLVFTSDRPPNEIAKLEDRLRSRFQGGLMVDIQPPDLETRIAILKGKLSQRGESLPPEILKLIAESVDSNTRELEGKLIQILQITKFHNLPQTEENIRQFLGKPQIKSHTLKDHKRVLSLINQFFNLKLSDLTGPRRQKELVLPRQIAMYILYEDCKIPMEKVGEILGGRDHTTVLHGIEKIRLALNRDREIQRLIFDLKNQLTTA